MITPEDIEVTSFILSTVATILITTKIGRDWCRERHNQKRFEREQKMRNEMIMNSHGNNGMPRPTRAKCDQDRPTFSDGIREVIAERKRSNALENGKQD